MNVVVTAGPTREPIDPVRFISNRSSGKMGYALARAALEDGHDVTLISGPVCLSPPQRASFVAITTSDELQTATFQAAQRCEVLIMCAAVADFKPAHFIREKPAKQHKPFSLDLVPTIDILSSLGSGDRNFFLVGFAAETHDVENRARAKLERKNCDMIIANDVSRTDSGMEADENEVIVITRDGSATRMMRAQKEILARKLVKKICAEAKKVLTKKR